METENEYQEWLKVRKKALGNFAVSIFCAAILLILLYCGASNKPLMTWLDKYYIGQLLAVFGLWRCLYVLPYITANVRRNHRLDR